MKHTPKVTQVGAYEWIAQCPCGWMLKRDGKRDAIDTECDFHVFENSPVSADRVADLCAEVDRLRVEIPRGKPYACTCLGPDPCTCQGPSAAEVIDPRDYLGEARLAAIDLANKMAQQKIAAAEVIAAAEKALERLLPWALQAGANAEDALALCARWKEANGG